MSVIEPNGVITGQLNPEDYGKCSNLKTDNASVNLVVGAAEAAERFVTNKQWNLIWRDSDLLYQSPRPMSVYENTYVLEPNVQRFTVAKVVNAIVPQLYKGLFYADPPILMRPRPGTSQDMVRAKTAMFSYLLDQCKFKTETKWGMEQMTCFGTGIWKWGIDYQEVTTTKRTATSATIDIGGQTGPTSDNLTVPLSTLPKIEKVTRTVPRPFFESRPLNSVLVDPKCDVGDIRQADYVIDLRYVDFYALERIRVAIEALPDKHPDKEGWELPKTTEELKAWWMQPYGNDLPSIPSIDSATYMQGAVHHSEQQNVKVTPDLLMKKLELLEYWDKGRKIVVIDRKHLIFSGKNRFGCIPFLSCNWWNRPKAFYGMGLGLIVGQNQRVDQGTINAVLKMLSFGVNPVYLRQRDSNNPTQMIRTGLGKIITVDNPVSEAYKLLDQPKVPAEVWSALSESEKATESTSGADQTLVQGSTTGPRTSMGRTAGGASILAGASATRLDGPLDNFIEQVFKPFLYILDDLVLNYIPDAEIMAILGEELGKDYSVDLQDLHDARMEYEVLAGASLSAKRTMAQSMTLITQILDNPKIQDFLADINGQYIDWSEIVKMWLEASEWKNTSSIIKPMTDEMKQKREQQSQAAMQNTKAAQQQQADQDKFAQKQQLQTMQANDRIKLQLIKDAFRANSSSMATEGVPSTAGLDGMEV